MECLNREIESSSGRTRPINTDALGRYPHPQYHPMEKGRSTNLDREKQTSDQIQGKDGEWGVRGVAGRMDLDPST